MPYEFIARNGLIAQNDSIITGSLTVTGTITATTLVAQTITSSTSWITGSTKFGSTTSNTHQFTGSIYQSGSEAIFAGNVGISTTNPDVFSRSYNGRILGISSLGQSAIELNGAAGSAAYIDMGVNGTRYLGLYSDASSSDISTIGAYPLTFGTNSTTRVAITSGGNVGIGTTSPNSKLQVLTAGGSAFDIDFRNNNANYEAITLGAKLTADTNWSLSAIYGGRSADGNSYLGFQTGTGGSNTERMRIASDGNVGIGTTSPAEILTVNGNLFLTGSSRSVWIGNNGDSKPRLRLHHNGTEAYLDYSSSLYIRNGDPGIKMTFDPNGNVGIGTTSPATLLHLYQNTAGIQNQLILENINTAEGADGNSIYFKGYQGSLAKISAYGIPTQQVGGYLQLQSYNDNTTANTGLIINNVGNVGIGTTSPGYLLDVAGSSRSDLHIFRSNQSAPTADAFIFRPADNTVALGTANTERMRITSAGVVQVGQSVGNDAATRYLQIQGSGTTSSALELINYWNSTAYTAGVYGGKGSNAASTLLFKVGYFNGSAAAQRNAMFIDENGNVGIGTTSPSSAGTGITTLDINGSSAGGVALGISGTKSYIYGASTLYVDANTTLAVYTSGSEKMRITSGGNVGIGTTSPNGRLEIYGGSLATGGGGMMLSSQLTTGRTGTYDAGTLGSIHNYFDASSTELTAGSSAGWVSGISVTGNNATLFQGTIRFTTISAERMRITNTGNIGIGTTTPSGLLTVAQSVNSGTANVLYLSNPSQTGTTAAAINFINADSTIKSSIIAAVYNNDYMTFNVGSNTERVRINANGNVGIGTTSPSYTLDVIGNIATDYTINDSGTPFRLVKPRGGTYTTGASTQTGAIRITYPVGLTNTMHHVKARVYEYSTNRSFTIHFGGYNYQPDSSWYNTFAYVEGDAATDINPNVRFGYNGSRMVVYIGELASSWTYPQVFIDEVGLGFGGQSTAWATEAWSIGFETSAFASATATITNTKSHVFARSGANAYYSTGNVGIGTTSPRAKLDVEGGIIIQTNNNLSWGNAYGAGVPTIAAVSGSGAFIAFYPAGSSSLEKMRIAADGNVGIGTTSPGAKLHIKRTSSEVPVQIDSTNATSASYTQYLVNGSGGWEHGMAGSGDTYKYFFSYGSFGSANAKLTFQNDGNVGIGTTSPATKFHVVTGDVGNIALFQGGSGRYMQIGTDSGGQYVEQVGTSAGERIFRIQNSNGTGTYTALYLDGANQRIYTSATANVGIGTTAPAYKLDISTAQSIRIIGSSTGYTQGSIILQSSTTDTPSARGLGIYSFNEGTDATWFYGSGYNYGDAFVINRKTGSAYQDSAAAPGESSNWFLINNSGNVGIGTTSPAYKLDVSGSIGMNGRLFAFNSATYTQITDPAGSIKLYLGASGDPGNYYDNTSHNFRSLNGGSTYVTINSNGNVGIGTTSPGVSLDVNGSGIRIINSTPNVYFNNTTVQWKAYMPSNNFAINDAVRDVLTLGYNGAASYFSGCNVGIGTTSPSAKLQVSGSTNVVNIIGSGSAASSSIFSVDGNNGRLFEITDDLSDSVFSANTIAGLPVIEAFSDYTVRLGTYGGASGSTVNITGSNVGIGTTSPGAKLHVVGSGLTEIRNTNGASSFKIITGTGFTSTGTITNDPLVIVTNDTERMRILSGGNVGIGTTSPAYALDVTGTIRATGDVIAYSDARVKDNVETITDALTKVTSLRGVSYTRNDSEDKSTKVGVIAQEVLDILPEVVQQDDNGNYSVAYGNIVGVLIEAIKELKAEIDILKNK